MKMLLNKFLLFILFLIASQAAISQSRIHPFLGLHASGDAEMYYLGPSIQAGMDVDIKPNFGLSSYLHFFPRKFNRSYPDGRFEKGDYKAFTAALLLESRPGRFSSGFSMAGGLAFQHLNDSFSSDFTNWKRERNILVAALRIGYAFPIKNQRLSIDLNATGPSFYNYEDNGFSNQVIEILTQLSLGMRVGL
jgi:hypothetical protein